MVAIQPIIDAYQESSLENLGKVVTYSLTLYVCFIDKFLGNSQDITVEDALIQSSKLQHQPIFQHHPIKS